MMKLRKFMAGTLAVTMVAGSSVVAFADDANTGSATGSGTSVGHVDKEVLTVTLPTDSSVTNVFDYRVDPERVIDLAGKFTDDTTVTKNADGVYFKNKDNSYSSSSDEVEFEGKNSVAVDVSVVAEVEASAAAEKDIALVADDAALTAADTPALLMNLTVGTDVKVITAEGATAKAELEGKPDNFEVQVVDGAYKYVAKTGVTGWDKTSVKLSGKTNQMDVPSDMTAPKIKLTWTIEKHVDSYLSVTTMSASSNSVELSMPEGVSLSKAEITLADGTGAIDVASYYTLDGTTFTISPSALETWVGLSPAYNKLVLTFSDNKSETITLQ